MTLSLKPSLAAVCRRRLFSAFYVREKLQKQETETVYNDEFPDCPAFGRKNMQQGIRRTEKLKLPER